MNKKIIIFLVLLVLSLAISGCSDKEENNATIEGEDSDVDVTYTESDSSDEDFPVGTTLPVNNPKTGETITMEIVGTEMVENKELYHAVYETDTPTDDGMVRMEYWWSDEDKEVFMWKAYDEDGNVMSEIKSINGKITVIDEEGNVVSEMDIHHRG